MTKLTIQPPSTWSELFTTLWRPVRDDRNHPTQARPRAYSRQTERLRRLAESEWLRLRRAHPDKYRRVTALRLIMLAVWAAVLILGYNLLAAFNHSLSTPDWFVFFGIVPYTIALVLLFNRWEDRLRFHVSRAHFLDESLCPSCGYALDRSTAEPDDCCVCPECGAAWTVPASAQPGP